MYNKLVFSVSVRGEIGLVRTIPVEGCLVVQDSINIISERQTNVGADGLDGQK